MTGKPVEALAMDSQDARIAAVHRAADFLYAMADKLDDWASESRQGGWSTHQVEANIDTANRCRREAAELRRVANS